MTKATLWGLLCMLFVSKLNVAAQSSKVSYTLLERQTLNVSCPFSIWKYPYSQKAWQRITDRGEPLTLAVTERVAGKSSQVQVGRYLLEDISSEAILHVRMTDLQVEDSRLYRCVIYHPPREPELLFHPVRLLVIKDPSDTPASDKTPVKNLAQITTLPSITKTQRKLHTSSRTVTQILPKLSASVSSPGLEVNPTNVTNVTRTSVIFIIIPLACGLLSKSLIFIVLFVVTQRSFVP